jgi:hypothetical protein
MYASIIFVRNKKSTVPLKYIKDLIISSTLMALCFTQEVYAASGMDRLDKGGWALVGTFQRIIFWASMIYTFKALLEVVVKGEGSWKKVGNGALICAFSYLVPTLWQIIRESFS